MWARKCDECGHIQTDKKPIGNMTTAYMNRKCKKCHSSGLDSGHDGYEIKNGKIVRKEYDED